MRTVFQYSCRSWSRQNGLPANAVFAITQTADGYLWLGTPRGLVRFDGEEFKLLDMAELPGVRSSIVTSISRARAGGLWFGLERGAFAYCDGRDITLLGREDFGGKSLLVQSVLESRDGSLWIAAERLGARLVDTNTFQTVLTNTGNERFDVTALAEDSRGRIWLGTSQKGLYYWERGTLTKFPDPKLDQFNIRALLEDPQGQLWVGTERGLFRYNDRFEPQPFPSPWYETRVLLADRQGTVWAGTSGGGLVRILNGEPAQFQKVDGLADDFVSALAEDQEGSLWVGTRKGLSQLGDVKIPIFGKHEGLTADVNVGVFASWKGGVWVATGNGFTYFDGQAQPYPTNGLENAYIMNVLEARNGDLYVVDASRNLQIFSGGRIVASYPNKSWPSAMTEDAQGVVVAIGGELFRAGTNGLAPYAFEHGRKPPLRWMFSMMTARDGSIWMAGNEGICRVNQGTFTAWTVSEGLPNSKAMSVCEDDRGVVWAGLETGMARIKDGRLRVITKDDGLYDNIIYTIVPDDRGSLWVDSGRGFFRVGLKSLNDFADGKIPRVTCVGFDGIDAIKSSEKYQQKRCGCKSADGRIWFPTAEGIACIDPVNMAGRTTPPRVQIQGVRANGQELEDADSSVARPGIGDLEFHYAGLSFIAPQSIRYRYRLQGHDTDWVDAGTRRAAFYTNLKPGSYNFEVQARNEDGEWNLLGAVFTVRLLPHYYQTAWFYAAAGFLACGALFGSYRWRVSQLRRKHLDLQKARDLLETRVKERTASLVSEVQERMKAQAELEGRKAALEKEIDERKRMEVEVERVHRQLVDASRLAGQAEVASNVLHNVGNVLNSVNVSTSVVADRLRRLELNHLVRAAELLEQHSADLGRFLTTDEKGRKLPQFLGRLAGHLTSEQEYLLGELKDLADNVDHIKGIVAMQQTYASASGVLEEVEVRELLEAALKLHATRYQRNAVEVKRHYEEAPKVVTDRHKVLQILINLLKNAAQACAEGGAERKQVAVRIARSGTDGVKVEIADNGVGIAPQNLTRIFSHGFTTRKNGHGFGLHSAALAAKAMGGTLTVQSEGPGQGASFVLELPRRPAETGAANPPA